MTLYLFLHSVIFSPALSLFLLSCSDLIRTSIKLLCSRPTPHHHLRNPSPFIVILSGTPYRLCQLGIHNYCKAGLILSIYPFRALDPRAKREDDGFLWLFHPNIFPHSVILRLDPSLVIPGRSRRPDRYSPAAFSRLSASLSRRIFDPESSRPKEKALECAFSEETQ